MSKADYKCTACGHVQQVTEVHTEYGVYVGSGANWCDKCGDGKPERVEPLARSSAANQAEAARATARIAIGHLQAVLNKARTHTEQQAADAAARDWLISIGSEPA
jgi:hypothetical protein